MIATRNEVTVRKLTCCLLFLFSTIGLWAASRQWRNGTLAMMERQQVKTGTTTFRTDDGDIKHKDGNAKSSGTGRDVKTDDVDTFEVYTIETGNRVYVAQEKLYFPWSKPAVVTVGNTLQFAVEGNKLYILGEDLKEHKATVIKVKMSN